MAKLAKEAATFRRVLESLFRYFDGGKLWSLDQSLPLLVLKDIQLFMDGSGQSTHVLLSTLIKHLDHKNIVKAPAMQVDIVEVTTSLAQHAKVEASVAIIGAVSDLIRHLRKSIHCSLDDSSFDADVKKWSTKFREAVDKCLVKLTHKLGDAGAVLELMAATLENISSNTVLARTTISAVYRTAQIIAPIPNLLYKNKTFPEALFHQLVPAMVHPDHETRVGAHRIFSVVLVPSSVSPCATTTGTDATKSSDIVRTLSRTVSVFSSSAALFEKLKREKTATGNIAGTKDNSSLSSFTAQISVNNADKETEVGSIKLNSRQISILLSSIWLQSLSPENTPENYEAIAHTYSLVLLFSRGKNSSHDALIRSFQLAFSLRNIAFNDGEKLSPSRRRSVFILATSLVLFSSKAYNVVPLIYRTKVVLTQKLVDPFLRLVDDHKLQCINTATNRNIVFGSKEDDNAALECLSQIDISGDQSNEFYAAETVKSLGAMEESKMSDLQEQLLKEFLPDDVCPFGAQLVTARTHQTEQVDSKDDSQGASGLAVEEAFIDSVEGQGVHKEGTMLQNPHLLSVNQLIDSVTETADHVGRKSVTAPDATFKEMALQCEALQMGKQKKMSHVLSVAQMRQESGINLSQFSNDDAARKVGNPLADQNLNVNSLRPPMPAVPMQCATASHHQHSMFNLPALSPYDNFLKAAGS